MIFQACGTKLIVEASVASHPKTAAGSMAAGGSCLWASR
jgi:hypothetical protein